MHIISIKRLRAFWAIYEDAEGPLRVWHGIASKAQWGSIAKIRRSYPHADFVTPNHTVFNIEGNTYRLIVKIEYRSRIIFIKTVLTHVQYDKGLWK